MAVAAKKDINYIRQIKYYKTKLKKDPFNIKFHNKLLECYRAEEMYAQISLESETIYWIQGINRRYL